jgi:pimeloyl-ACP methyl ester carboxylesterase
MLICHGFKGFKDYGFLPILAEHAACREVVAHRFNFSHSGMTENLETFEKPSLFEQDTFNKQVHDLLAVSRAAASGDLSGGGKAMPTVWFGHSRGGIDILLAASRVFAGGGASGDAAPVGLVVAASPHKAIWLQEQSLRAIRRKGFVNSPSARTGQVLRVGRAWLEEVERSPGDFDPLVAIGRVRCPVLIVHGDADATVTVDSAHALANAAGGRAEVRVIRGASHTFNTSHPVLPGSELPAEARELIEASCDFAVRVCGGDAGR